MCLYVLRYTRKGSYSPHAQRNELAPINYKHSDVTHGSSALICNFYTGSATIYIFNSYLYNTPLAGLPCLLDVYLLIPHISNLYWKSCRGCGCCSIHDCAFGDWPCHFLFLCKAAFVVSPLYFVSGIKRHVAACYMSRARNE